MKNALISYIRNFFKFIVFWERTNDKRHIIFTFLGIHIKIKSKRLFKIQKSYMTNIPLKENKIVIYCHAGKKLNCNPKYIVDEIIKQKLPYEIVWLLDKNIQIPDDVPKEIKIIRNTHKNFIREFTSSKIWISNQRISELHKLGLSKKENQFYIQTWHGSLGIKKIEKAARNLNKKYIKIAKTDSKYIDYILSNSSLDDFIFKHDFWYNGEIIKTGHPRCDIFFFDDTQKEKIKNKVKKTLEIGCDKNIILYVPSFRGNYNTTAYNIDTEKTLCTLKNKFNGDWVFVTRMHPNLPKEAQEVFTYNDKVKNATTYHDEFELLLSADVVISDYSSCIFDFMLTKKPAFIYATDKTEYAENRGFYYPLENTPFPVATNNKELVEKIADFDENKYKLAIDDFLQEHECIEDGHSSERVVELIKKLMNQ